MPNLSERLKALKVKAADALRPGAADAAPPLSNEAVIWAIRVMLGREPHNSKEIARFRRSADLGALRRALAETAEFKGFLSTLKPWAAPLFLLEAPANRSIPAVFRPPSLAAPTSQLCTEAQFREELHTKICNLLALPPSHMHRKNWEFVWIIAVLHRAGLLRTGKRALGFGVGNEPLPAFFAKVGMEVLATDAPPDGPVRRTAAAGTPVMVAEGFVNDLCRCVSAALLLTVAPAAFTKVCGATKEMNRPARRDRARTSDT